MTTPNQQHPDGSITDVGSWGQVQRMTQDDWKNQINSEWDGKYLPVQNGANFLIVLMLRMLANLLDMVPIVGDTMAQVVNNIADGLNQTNTKAITADQNATQAGLTAQQAQVAAGQATSDASTALTAAQNAANAAAAAQETADVAYNNAKYWEAECVVASAEVLYGANELLIGLCQNVPTGMVRLITDLHVAMQENPAGVSTWTKKWAYPPGPAAVSLHLTEMGPNVTRISYNNLGIQVNDKERIFWDVAWIGGNTAPPRVLQVLMFGVIYDPSQE